MTPNEAIKYLNKLYELIENADDESICFEFWSDANFLRAFELSKSALKVVNTLNYMLEQIDDKKWKFISADYILDVLNNFLKEDKHE